MPGGDRTGPIGMGSMTGRAAGFCAGNSLPGYANSVGGRGFLGFGRGRGFGGRGGGRGWRNQFYATGVPGSVRAGYPTGFPAAPETESEQQILKQQAQYLQESLNTVNKRIEELEKK